MGNFVSTFEDAAEQSADAFTHISSNTDRLLEHANPALDSVRFAADSTKSTLLTTKGTIQGVKQSVTTLTPKVGQTLDVISFCASISTGAYAISAAVDSWKSYKVGKLAVTVTESVPRLIFGTYGMLWKNLRAILAVKRIQYSKILVIVEDSTLSDVMLGNILEANIENVSVQTQCGVEIECQKEERGLIYFFACTKQRIEYFEIKLKKFEKNNVYVLEGPEYKGENLVSIGELNLSISGKVDEVFKCKHAGAPLMGLRLDVEKLRCDQIRKQYDKAILEQNKGKTVFRRGGQLLLEAVVGQGSGDEIYQGIQNAMGNYFLHTQVTPTFVRDRGIEKGPVE